MNGQQSPNHIAPLSGDLVVDLSVGVAGGYCTKLLADGGAQVVKLEPPVGDPLRQRTSRGPTLDAGQDGALFQALSCSKDSVVLDPAHEQDIRLACDLVESADVVVWTPGSALTAHAELAPGALAERAPHAVVTTITPFGLTGPWSGRAASDLTLQAWSGGMATRGRAERPPVSWGGQPSAWVAGAFAAAGALTAWHRSVRTCVGELVDVSELEAMALATTMYPVTWLSEAKQPFRTKRFTNIPDIERTRDGWVGFMIVTAQMWQDFCVLVERPDWLDDESLYSYSGRDARRAELEEAISAWTSRHTTDEVVEQACLLRVPVAPVGRGTTVTEFDHLRDGGFFVRNPAGGFLQPDVPYRLSRGATRRPLGAPPTLDRDGPRYRKGHQVTRRAAAPTAEPGSMPFAGLRVADFTFYWAGPIVSHHLAMYGAEVIHVESVQRMDGIRGHTTKTVADDQWWEHAPLFHGSNSNKKAITLDMSREEGRALARRLIAASDVVLENFSPRVFDHWGLDYERMSQDNPGLIMLRMPAFGLTGPWSTRTGFAQNMEQASGLAWVTGYPDGSPTTVNGPCDPLAGTHSTIALLLALEHRRRSGHGMLIESPMIGAALNLATESIVEAGAYGREASRIGNRSPSAAPQNLYLTAADPGSPPDLEPWVAISIETDDQWRRLVEALGCPVWATDPSLAGVDGRHAAHDRIDAELTAWCARRTADDIVDALWPAGIPVAKVLRGDHQVDLPPLRSRGFFETVRHPLVGDITLAGYPARLTAGPDRLHRSAPPTLGEHNEEVLGGLLGLDDDQVEALTEAGVIGQRPVGLSRSR